MTVMANDDRRPGPCVMCHALASAVEGKGEKELR